MLDSFVHAYLLPHLDICQLLVIPHERGNLRWKEEVVHKQDLPRKARQNLAFKLDRTIKTNAYQEPCSQGQQPSALFYQFPVFLDKRFGSVKVICDKPVPGALVCLHAGATRGWGVLTDLGKSI